MYKKINIEGIIESVIFNNIENGYTVFSVFQNNKEDPLLSCKVTCVGYTSDLNEGENIKITGSIVDNPKYGKQILVESYEKSFPTTEEGIEKYLASGFIKGIGNKIAKSIVEKFGVKTFDIIEKNPEKLSEIKGISIKRAIEIHEIFLEQAEFRRVMLFLQKYGISNIYALKIYKHYGLNTIKVVEKNPYSLSDEIFGIGFKMADNIAQKVGIEKDSPYRIKSGIKFALTQASNNAGNVYLPENELIADSIEILELEEEIIKKYISDLQIERQICVEKTKKGNIVFLNYYFYAESNVAKKLLELSMAKTKYKKSYETRIKNLEKEKNINLAEEQKLAIKEAMINGVLVITGGPGTGKTTTINTIIAMLKNEGYEIELCAPTGRAAKRMTEATGIEAQTIHRLLGISYISENKRRQFFTRDEESPIETEVIIVDESSMIDINLMNSFLSAVSKGTKLILVGDVDQLPSVGAGNVLKDIINSKCIKVVRLNQIFRQSSESAIIMNAHRINRGEYPILNERENDFFFVKRTEIEQVSQAIKELITERLPKFLNISDLKEIQVLCPMRKSPIGVTNLNNILQEALNPPSEEKNELQYRALNFREGDKVMQIKNNYNIVWKAYKNGEITDEGCGVFNGDEGIISDINLEKQKVTVVFDECKFIEYDFSQLDEIDLAYAVTIHKSQGSEYKAVIIPIHSGPPMLLTRNLLYTAITRAKKIAVIVGIPEVLNKMVDNNREINRYTYLKERIINLKEFILD